MGVFVQGLAILLVLHWIHSTVFTMGGRTVFCQCSVLSALTQKLTHVQDGPRRRPYGKSSFSPASRYMVLILPTTQVEYGKPSELLNNHEGMLRALVEESGDAKTLLAMAGLEIPN